MRPLKSSDGSTLRKELANEEGIVNTLATYVFDFSNHKFKVQRVRKYGLLVR